MQVLEDVEGAADALLKGCDSLDFGRFASPRRDRNYQMHLINLKPGEESGIVNQVARAVQLTQIRSPEGPRIQPDEFCLNRLKVNPGLLARPIAHPRRKLCLQTGQHQLIRAFGRA